jgi:S1-C subfamily serine protease
VARPWLGAALQAVTPEIAESIGLKRPAGAMVSNVVEGSPAAKAGLASGDVVVAVDGRPVDDVDSFAYRFATRPIGGVTGLTVQRGGRDHALSVALSAAPETPPRDLRTIKGYSPFAGATVANLSPALSDELSLSGPDRGVVVTETEDGSTAQQLGFRKGDVVRDINEASVGSTQELERASARNPRLWKVTIERGGRTFTSVFGG